jgi:hypothetical protein
MKELSEMTQTYGAIPVTPGTMPETFVLANLVHVVLASATHQLSPFSKPTDTLWNLAATHCDGVKLPVSTMPKAALTLEPGANRRLSP